MTGRQDDRGGTPIAKAAELVHELRARGLWAGHGGAVVTVDLDRSYPSNWIEVATLHRAALWSMGQQLTEAIRGVVDLPLWSVTCDNAPGRNPAPPILVVTWSDGKDVRIVAELSARGVTVAMRAFGSNVDCIGAPHGDMLAFRRLMVELSAAAGEGWKRHRVST